MFSVSGAHSAWLGGDIDAAREVQLALARPQDRATVLLAPQDSLPLIVAIASLLFLAALGAVSAVAGGASLWRASLRVTLWGALAMAATAGIGALFGTVA